MVGSSVNFTWSFISDSNGVRGVLWGLKRDGASSFVNNGILVAFNQSGSPVSVPVPAEYSGRVSGSRSGSKLSGQAVFTLSLIKEDDERFFGCSVDPINDFETIVFDSVFLVVEGEQQYRHIHVALI